MIIVTRTGWMSDNNGGACCLCVAVQGEAEHAGHLGDEPVAGRQAARHRRMGRRRSARGQLAALRRARRRHHHVRPRPIKVRHAGPARRRGRLRLGLLRVQGAHPRVRQIRYVPSIQSLNSIIRL